MTDEQFHAVTLALSSQTVDYHDKLSKNDYTNQTTLEIVAKLRTIDRIHDELNAAWREAR